MTSLVLDTHAVIWHLCDSSRLSPSARAAIGSTTEGGSPAFVSAITVAEVTYLVEKGRLQKGQLTALLMALRRPDSDLRVQPVDLAVAEALGRIPRSAVPDLPDRIIAATALHLGLPLVTIDHRLRSCGLPTIW